MSDQQYPVSATERLGPHLLGRRYEPDTRDWTVEQLQRAATAFIDDDATRTIAQLTTEGKLTTWASVLLFWRWLKVWLGHPAPQPHDTTLGWAKAEATLDQGQTPHCVGFGWAQWGNTEPVDDAFANADGDAIYYACKVRDGEPNAETGSSERTGALVMRDRGRLAAFAVTSKSADVIAWLNAHGSAVAGTNWYDGMFTPDAETARIHLGGNVAGGHCYVLSDYLDDTQEFQILNSWGNWGHGGYAYISRADFERLLAEQGAVVLALEAPR